jgi:hypothetical protein
MVMVVEEKGRKEKKQKIIMRMASKIALQKLIKLIKGQKK